MSDLVKRLRQEAGRNARMQADKEHQTNRRRKTFRGRNLMLTQAIDRIEELEAQLDAVRKLSNESGMSVDNNKLQAAIKGEGDETLY